MEIKFRNLKLQCKRSEEILEFSPQVTYIHGPISTGKSSIARLIDFCLGGSLEETTAISEELVSSRLDLLIGKNLVIFERAADKSSHIQASWTGVDGVSRRALVPVEGSLESGPVLGEGIYNISDLIYSLAGISPPRVRLSKRDSDSRLVRLGFRDIMWYCYLQQEKLASSFFRLQEQFYDMKSRDVMRFVVGEYSEELTMLELELDRLNRARS
jgi:hypothetical protein